MPVYSCGSVSSVDDSLRPFLWVPLLFVPNVGLTSHGPSFLTPTAHQYYSNQRKARGLTDCGQDRGQGKQLLVKCPAAFKGEPTKNVLTDH